MVLKCEIDFEIPEFYRIQTFPKSLQECVFFFDFFNKSEYERHRSGRGSCSSSYPSGNLVDGLPLVAVLTHSSNSRALPPRRSVMLDVGISIQMTFRIEVTGSVLFKVFKSYWRFTCWSPKAGHPGSLPCTEVSLDLWASLGIQIFFLPDGTHSQVPRENQPNET